MLLEINKQARTDMALEPAPYKRIGYYSQYRDNPLVIWEPEDWERPLVYCVNDLVDMPEQGIGRVTSVHCGTEIEIVKRMVA